MMYPYMTLNDDTEITHSEIHDDGVFKRRRVCECLKSLESDPILYISGREKKRTLLQRISLIRSMWGQAAEKQS